MTFADSSLVKGFLSAANTDWLITTAIIKRKYRMHLFYPMSAQGRTNKNA